MGRANTPRYPLHSHQQRNPSSRALQFTQLVDGLYGQRSRSHRLPIRRLHSVLSITPSNRVLPIHFKSVHLLPPLHSRLIAVSSSSSLLLYDMRNTSVPLTSVPLSTHHDGTRIHWSADASSLAVNCGEDGVVRVDLASLQPTHIPVPQ